MPRTRSLLWLLVCTLALVLLSPCVHAAAPLTVTDSALLCSTQQLLVTSLPEPSVTLQRGLARLHALANGDAATATASLPGLPSWCVAGTALALRKAIDNTTTAAAQAKQRELDQQTRQQLGIGAVRVYRSVDLPPTSLLNSSADLSSVEGETQHGYHRQLHTTIHVQPAAAASEAANGQSLLARLQRCDVLLLESVPSTLYFDLYQLSDLSSSRTRLHQTYPPLRALPYGDIDVEMAAEASPVHLLWMVVERPQWRAASAANDGSALLQLQVPIHARYQAARNVTCDSTLGDSDPCLRPAVLEAPRVFIRCPVPGGPSAPVQQQARQDPQGRPPLGDVQYASPVTAWVGLDTPLPGPEVHIMVPIASLENLVTVRAVTIAVSMGAAVLLIALLVCRAPQRTGKAAAAPHRD